MRSMDLARIWRGFGPDCTRILPGLPQGCPRIFAGGWVNLQFRRISFEGAGSRLLFLRISELFGLVQRILRVFSMRGMASWRNSAG